MKKIFHQCQSSEGKTYNIIILITKAKINLVINYISNYLYTQCFGNAFTTFVVYLYILLIINNILLYNKWNVLYGILKLFNMVVIIF